MVCSTLWRAHLNQTVILSIKMCSRLQVLKFFSTLEDNLISFNPLTITPLYFFILLTFRSRVFWLHQISRLLLSSKQVFSSLSEIRRTITVPLLNFIIAVELESGQSIVYGLRYNPEDYSVKGWAVVSKQIFNIISIPGVQMAWCCV